jgi:hypothetical protein
MRIGWVVLVCLAGCGQSGLGTDGDAGADSGVSDLAVAADLLGPPCNGDAFVPTCDDQHYVHVCTGGHEESGFFCGGAGPTPSTPSTGRLACVAESPGTGQPAFHCVDTSLTPCDSGTFQQRCDGNGIVSCYPNGDPGSPGFTSTNACYGYNPVCVSGNATVSCTFAGAKPCTPNGGQEYCDPSTDPSGIFGCAATGFPSKIECVGPGPNDPCTCAPAPAGSFEPVDCVDKSGSTSACGFSG